MNSRVIAMATLHGHSHQGGISEGVYDTVLSCLALMRFWECYYSLIAINNCARC